MSLSAPTQLTQQFCSAGVKNTIPNPSQIGINPGLASFTDGFPPATRAPVASGGIPPYGEDMNGILNQLSAPIQWDQAGGRYPYLSAFATAIGGYPLSAIIQSSDGAGSWLNTSANNSNDPEAAVVSPTWQPVGFRGISTIPLTNANVTLTNLQSARETIIFTGTLTANVVVTVQAFTKDFKFINATTGNFTVSVKTSAGAALGIDQGGKLDLYGDGTTLNLAASASAPSLIGQFTNAAFTNSTGSSTGTWTADEIIVGTRVGGTAVKIKNVSFALNLASSGASGGMDTGSAPASGYVGVYAFYNPTTGAVDSRMVNATAAAVPTVYGGSNAPAGYTMSALVSVLPTSALSQFTVCAQRNRRITTTLITLLSTTTPVTGINSFAIAAGIPRNAIEADLVAGATQGTAGSGVQMSVSGNAAGVDPGVVSSLASSGTNASTIKMRTMIANALYGLYYVMSNTNAGTFTVQSVGYSI